jgi:gluconokinase
MKNHTGPFIVMGVSGCGKSTIASQLAGSIGAEFLDADDFHPAANIQKMAAGIPLTDEDRWPWLESLNHTLRERDDEGRPVVLACSALRQAYREVLSRSFERVVFIYLAGSKDEIQSRLESRSGHFMPAKLLDSQFAMLEEPADAIRVSIAQSPEDMIAEILARLAE